MRRLALFEQALKIDPNDPDALAGEAECYLYEHLYWNNPQTDYDAKVIGQADRAIALAADNVWAYYVKSAYLSLSRRFDEALRTANAGLAINPNYASLYYVRANAKSSLGQFEQAKPDVKQAMRLSPRDPRIGVFHMVSGDAELGLGHFDAAIDEYRNATDSGFRPFTAYTNLAAAYALKGKMDEAKTALAEARRLNPKLTVKWMIAHTPESAACVRRFAKGGAAGRMSETRKIAAILVADVVGYSRLAGADEDRTLSRLRGLRSDLIDPAIAAHHGRVVKRTGDGSLIEFRSVVDAVRCADRGAERHGRAQRRRAARAPHRVPRRHSSRRRRRGGRRRSDGRRRQYRRAPGGHRRARRDLSLRGRLSPGEGAARSRGHRSRPDPTQEHRRADPGLFAQVGAPATAKPAPAPAPEKSAPPRLSIVVLPFANIGGDPEQEHFVDGVTESLTTDLSRIRGAFVIGRNTAFTYKGKPSI